jgi:hypothetical protein
MTLIIICMTVISAGAIAVSAYVTATYDQA